MNVFLALLLSNLIFFIFIAIRNEYTYNRRMETAEIISQYMESKISDKDFDMVLNTWDDMTYSYEDYLWNLSLWGKYSAIKPEYKKILLEDREHDNQM